jgi:nucleoside-diphosphate-sugar epimerase
MTALVTGASGFLGGRLVELLAEQGEQVVVLARPTSGLGHLAALIDAGRVRVVRAELAFNFEARDVSPGLRDAVQGVDLIYHCAGCSTDWASARTYQQGNVLATQALLAAVAGSDTLRRFVHVSTTDVYGYPVIPCSETVQPVDVGLGYNQSKILGEQAVWRASEAGLPVTVLRPATIYGPRGTAFVTDIAKLLRERAMAYIDGGRVQGGFVYVDDVAEAMIAAAHSPATVGEAYNLSSLRGESWKQYCSLLAAALMLPPPWIDLPLALAMAVAGVMEAPHRYLRLPGRPLLTRHAVYLLGRNQEFPSAKAQAAFGYTPKVLLEYGLLRSVNWLRGQRVA